MNDTVSLIAEIVAENPDRAAVFTAALHGTPIGDQIIEEVFSVRPGESTLTWSLHSLEDAYQTRPPLSYVIDGLISRSSLSVVYGSPGVMKTNLLQDACICVAAGHPWLRGESGSGANGLATTAGTVLWIDIDNGSRRTHERMAAFGNGHGVAPNAPIRYISFPDPPLDPGESTSIARLKSLIAAEQVQMVVIDNLSQIRGNRDENTGDMNVIMSALRGIAEDTGAAVIVIHHQRKSSGVESRPGDSLRGHSGIEGAIDLALLVEREGRDDTISVKSTKTRDVSFAEVRARFQYEHKPNTKELQTARFVGTESPRDEGVEDLKEAILQAVGTNPEINQVRLKELVKAALPNMGIRRIQSEIDSVVGSGLIELTIGPHGSRLHSLTAADDR
jgi:RecA-family ATPase